jgi:hypothetical protein
MPKSVKGSSKRRGGRAPGTPNRRVLPLVQKAKELKVDPFEILLLFAKGDWASLGYQSESETKYSMGTPFEVRVISPDMRIVAAKEACKYMHPQRKAIDIKSDDEKINFCPVVILPSNGREKN